MSQPINIVKLIEENPNNKLSKSYQGNLINKIKDNFSTKDQELFISSFYCYLNYKNNDFVIDLDDMWKWLGFSTKQKGKELLEKHFTVDIDYELVFNLQVKNPKGGRPKEKFMLNVKTFKKMCLKANTEKANEIHEYYIRLEETLHEVINEESNELRNQLEIKTNEFINKTNELEKTKEEVQKLTKKYIKPPKEVYEEKNVVYLMTTQEGEKVNEYVVGKAIDLSNRKEEYNHNKLHDFKIIYYRTCNSAKLMDIIESAILMKLGKYRCKAGRDVFLLPENNIKLFTDIFDECVNFYEDVDIDHVIYPKRTLEKISKDKMKEKNEKYQSEHKDEIKEKQQIYYEENKDQLSDIGKIYYEKNADIINKKNKKYYETHREEVIEQVMGYYKENKEDILEDRKEFYENNKEQILNERAKYYKENYKTKIAVQRQKKEQCECGMTICHYSMKRHKNSERHKVLLEKIKKETCYITENNL